MSDTIIKGGDYAYRMIQNIFLDGEQQRGVVEINLTQGTITRGYRGPLLGPDQVYHPTGYVFDMSEEMFVRETVQGLVLIRWCDHERARKWLAKHSQA